MADLSYVRTEMVPEQAPPPSSVGVLGWLRENLFSGWFNVLLTLLSAAFITMILAAVLPWLFHSSWTAGSLNECRQQIAAAYGEHAEGACWAVIRERHLQLLFGFYPSELYWRPVLAFVVTFLALAPVLFPALPRKMLWGSVLVPFLVPWLLWGGTLWLPLTVLAGFGLGYVALRGVSGLAGGLGGVVAAAAVAVLWWLFLAGPVAQGAHALFPLGLEPVPSRQFGGFMLSITIGVVAITLSLPIGIVLALGRQSDLFILRTICVGFIEFVRGVPLITLLFVASVLLNYFLPPGTNFDIILRVIIMVTLFASAYMAEVIRGGLAALPKGQYEAADALGLDYWKAQRLIIMPQALKISIPGIVSTFIGVFKDTTLVSIIGLFDPIGLSNAIRADTNWNGIVWELYGFIALMFFVFCFSMSRYSMYLERKLQTERR
ncbi:L-glutamine ABC transporter membrane protein /L-glutamate ABC transporter membrane protein /L-aspartate ABC transporter membrane protein /L-asparagine ABC transporter membrane protein [Rhodovulum imhoffii]|uniref:L-glutamine ABC transporter membrane protein /L-glutamate ABC transporter membrane protein /L-aspartate ABC transporter membrane protein /L-asparagine ABC transporter membrane protein n=1 Tax=Rhodovulum imhoffii TaxID=365340 RepID=A0A2T5BRW6_9RHOB|nr:amino acid ABC transporter permease [Rhodovulum imhoffii]MBK5932531.1 amino acid ABC transporter permease [Rhodovulum imhoffii]PTN02057.1 L-glutamine ABC transporter membrane protein /L-glutamate ABC transporter membrane protein /L-aspartate ABC transporter membrane protein /L-asparagine ABC transporter membrane protein [Rhodovulum imhoffii]